MSGKWRVNRLCGYFDVSRSGYYKSSAVQERRTIAEAEIIGLVHQIRRHNPRMGCKKLYELLREEIGKIDRGTGRDKFFDIMRRHGLLVKRRKKYVYTTDSFHRFKVYKNKLRDSIITGPHQGWVSDITYLRTRQGFVYLFLITDVYSRKIVGWALSESLRIEGAIEALKMAIKQCPDTTGIIHHSDRGIQYCSHSYVEMLTAAKAIISMTEENHCYENATAERVNGILKDEYGLDNEFAENKEAFKAVKQAILCYNTQRPHWSLQLKIPDSVHKAA